MPFKYKHAILLVDDEASITKALYRTFRKEGYKIFTASSGSEGLALLKKVERPISLIISDQRMPEMTGAQFLEKAKKIFPDVIRFLLTGYSDMDAIVDAVNQGEIHRYLTKPWNDKDLLLQVRQSLEQFELRIENRRLQLLTQKQNKELKEFNKRLEQKVEERSREIIEKNTELSRLNNELESNLYNTVRAFASLAEMHAPSLADHGRRVSLLAREIALLSGLSQEEITRIEIAGLLHDVGKLGMPQRLIASCETKWTSKEDALFRKHPEKGQSIVQFIDQLEPLGDLIRFHHERFDGRGYPDQLKEEAIPVGSRIIAVADAYDKIVNLKVNLKARLNEYLKERNLAQDRLPEEELIQQAAFYHLKTNAFTQYDPDIVKVFLNLKQKNEVQSRRERKVSPKNLKESMVLSKSLYTAKGRFLLPHETVLTEDYIYKLRVIHQNDPLPDVIYVVEQQGGNKSKMNTKTNEQ